MIYIIKLAWKIFKCLMLTFNSCCLLVCITYMNELLTILHAAYMHPFKLLMSSAYDMLNDLDFPAYEI